MRSQLKAVIDISTSLQAPYSSFRILKKKKPLTVKFKFRPINLDIKIPLGVHKKAVIANRKTQTPELERENKTHSVS